jgi:hypothetical protein
VVSRQLSDQGDLKQRLRFDETMSNSDISLSNCLASVGVGSNGNMRNYYEDWAR